MRRLSVCSGWSMIINWIVISLKTILKNCTNSLPSHYRKRVRRPTATSIIPFRRIISYSIFSMTISDGSIPIIRTIPYSRTSSTKGSARMNGVEVKAPCGSLFVTDRRFRLALEEYENLKRAPDPRQLAAQRLQQQQQLTSAAMVQLPHLQQMYLDLFRTMSAEDQNTFDYSKMLQYAFEIGLGQALVDGQNLSECRERSWSRNPVVLPSSFLRIESTDDESEQQSSWCCCFRKWWGGHCWRRVGLGSVR